MAWDAYAQHSQRKILNNVQKPADKHSGYAELKVAQRVAVGLSSLVTHAQRDVDLQTADTRQAHGAFARVSPWSTLVLMAEADLVVHSLEGLSTLVGYASLLQADVEPLQGLHLTGAAESYKQ